MFTMAEWNEWRWKKIQVIERFGCKSHLDCFVLRWKVTQMQNFLMKLRAHYKKDFALHRFNELRLWQRVQTSSRIGVAIKYQLCMWLVEVTRRRGCKEEQQSRQSKGQHRYCPLTHGFEATRMPRRTDHQAKVQRQSLQVVRYQNSSPPLWLTSCIKHHRKASTSHTYQ